MSKKPNPSKLNIAFTTSMLFDMTEPYTVFLEQGACAYREYMVNNIDVPLTLSTDFETLRDYFENTDIYETFLFSRNNVVSSARVIRTLEKENIVPSRMVFTSGISPVPFLDIYNIDYYKTTNSDDVQNSILSGVSASYHGDTDKKPHEPENIETAISAKYADHIKRHYIFDLDGVVFDQTGEKFYQKHGLAKYFEAEGKDFDKDMRPGPMWPMLRKIDAINANYAEGEKPFLISIVTARGMESGMRAINVLSKWGVDINGQAHFGRTTSKGDILKVLKQQSGEIPCEFFDDRLKNVELANEAGLTTGLIPGFNY